MICEIDGLVLRGVQFWGAFFLRTGVLFEVLMAVRAHLFKIDAVWGVLVQVAFWDAVWGAAGCLGGCCLGCS